MSAGTDTIGSDATKSGPHRASEEVLASFVGAPKKPLQWLRIILLIMFAIYLAWQAYEKRDLFTPDPQWELTSLRPRTQSVKDAEKAGIPETVEDRKLREKGTCRVQNYVETPTSLTFEFQWPVSHIRVEVVEGSKGEDGLMYCKVIASNGESSWFVFEKRHKKLWVGREYNTTVAGSLSQSAPTLEGKRLVVDSELYLTAR